MPNPLRYNSLDASQYFDKKIEIILISLILFAAIFLRFYQLDVPSIWIDELNHYYAAESYLEQGEMVFPSGYSNERAAFYSKLVAFSFTLFGKSEFALRFPSALIGILCIVGGYFLSRLYFGQVTALFTAILMTLSPFSIGWARLSRMYTLFQLLFLGVVFLFYLGYEFKPATPVQSLQSRLLQWLRLSKVDHFLAGQQLNLLWIFAAFLLLYFTYTIHQLAALFIVGVFFYAAAMFVINAIKHGIFEKTNFKYSVTFLTIAIGLIGGYFLVPPIREMLNASLAFIPKWAEGTQFQDRKLFVNFLFDHFHFPSGILFALGAIFIVLRVHIKGIYLLSIFGASLFMFTFVFTYRHFQYLYNVYPYFIIISAVSLSVIFNHEIERLLAYFKQHTRIKPVLVSLALLGLLVLWMPLTQSVRFALRIPQSGDGKYNGAMYMEEWREAGRFVRERLEGDDIVISSDALGTLHYVGEVDFDLNFADFDLAKEEEIRGENGDYCDLYSGAPFVKTLDQLKQICTEGQTVWLLFQEYKFNRAPMFLPVHFREWIVENFTRELITQNGTVVVYKFTL